MRPCDPDATLWITQGRQNKIGDNAVDGLLEYVLVSLLSGSLSDLEVALIVLKLIEDIFTASEPIGCNWLQVLIKATMSNVVGHFVHILAERIESE